MISTSSRCRPSTGEDREDKPRVKMIAGGTRALKNSSSTGQEEKKETKIKETKKVKGAKNTKASNTKKDDSSSSYSESPLSRVRTENTMDNMHASYGSLGASHNSLYMSAPSGMNFDLEENFSTPRQQEPVSPWRVKLKKASPTSATRQVPTPPVVYRSPLKSGKERDEKQQSRRYNNNDLNPFLLEEFSTPRQSPWKSPVKKSMKASSQPPAITLDRNDHDDRNDKLKQEMTPRKKKKKEKLEFWTPRQSPLQKPAKTFVEATTRPPELVIDSNDHDDKNDKQKHEKKKKKETTCKNIKRVDLGTSSRTACVVDKSPKTSCRSSQGQSVLPVGILKSPLIQKSKKAVKFAAFNRVYGAEHITAATRIAALARGKHGRMQAKLLRLKKKLDNMGTETAKEIKRVQKATSAAKKDFRKRAEERHQKNLARPGDVDAKIRDYQKLIVFVRKENADFRERNKKLYEDVERLRINNERLEESAKAGAEFYDRLIGHDETCSAENAKITKIAASYEKAVAEHSEHLELHKAYGDAEYKMKMMYSKLLSAILDRVEGHNDKQFVDDIYSMAETLESQSSKKQKKST